MLPVRSEKAGLIVLLDEIVEIVIGLENHVAPGPSIASAGASFGTRGFAQKRDAAAPSMPCTGMDPDLVNEHRGVAGSVSGAPVPSKKGEADGLAFRSDARPA
jgi:hypothetical protein